MMAAGFPTQEEALAVHQRLLVEDTLAPSDLAVAYLDPLAGWLRDRSPRSESGQCDSAAEDALLALIKNPSAYHPERGTLAGYLTMAAWRDLQNIQRSEQRHANHRADWGAVELSSTQGKYLQDVDMDPARIVERQEQIKEMARERLPAAVGAGLSPTELAVVGLMQSGERHTASYAQLLGLAQLSAEEQRRVVKRVKDRLKVRIKRGRTSDD